MKIIAVKYTYDPNKSELLAEHRPSHRAFLRELLTSGQLLASGPLGENEALIIVRAENPSLGIALLDEDPLYQKGVILERDAKVWNPVLGPWAE